MDLLGQVLTKISLTDAKKARDLVSVEQSKFKIYLQIPRISREKASRKVAIDLRLHSPHIGAALRGPVFFSNKQPLQKFLSSELTQVAKPVKQILPFFAPNLIHQEAFKHLLTTIHRIISWNDERGSVRAPEKSELRSSYDKCHAIWQAKGFMNERTLLKELVNEFDSDNDLNSTIDQSLPVHDLTGYAPSAETPTAVALANDYAIATKNSMSIVFGDIANVGGTNDFFKKLITRESELSQICLRLNIVPEADDGPAQIKEKIAKRMTDWSVRIITGIIRKEFEEALPDDKNKLQFLGAGGDEFYITFPGDPSLAEEIIRNRVLPKVIKAIEELGLHSHAHRKKDQGKTPGLGVSFGAIKPLNEEVDPQEVSQKSAELKTSYSANPVENLSFENILLKLESPEYLPFKPQVIDLEELQKVLVFKDPKKVFESVDSIIRHQLFTMLNDATGVQDAKVIPKFIEAMQLKRGDFYLFAVGLKNLTAINEKTSHKDADDVLKDFAERVREDIKLDNAKSEIFSAGGGNFVCVVPAQATDASSSFVASIEKVEKDFNDRKIGSVRIGDLANPQAKGKFGVGINVSFRKPIADPSKKMPSIEAVVNQLVREIQ